jgi:hypothetical protein
MNNSIQNIKKQAKTLKALLDEMNVQISLSQCYEILAKINGFKDWNTMSAHLDQHELKDTATKLIPFHLPRELLEGVASELITSANKSSDLREVINVEKHPNNIDLSIDCINQKFTSDIENPSSDPKKNMYYLGIELANSLIKKIVDISDRSNTKVNFRKPLLTRGNYLKVVRKAEKEEQNQKQKSMLHIECEDVNFKKSQAFKKLTEYVATLAPVYNPLVYLLKITDFIPKKYYVGWGGGHIHIKENEKLLAIITAAK